MSAAVSSSSTPPRPRRGLVLWLLAFIILPNVPFALSDLVLTFNQSTYAVFMAGAGCFVGLLPAGAMVVIFLALYGFNFAALVSETFGLDLEDTIDSAHLLLELDPLAEPAYVLVGAVLVGCAAPALWLIARHRHEMARVSPRIGVLAAFLLPLPFSAISGQQQEMAGEINYLREMVFAPAPSAAPPAIGAVAASGFAGAGAREEGRALLLVIVEALGEFRDEAMREAIFAPLAAPGIADRYAVSRGTVPYRGSTTAAEMRELCGSTVKYRAIRDGEVAGPDCLPARLRAGGYDTIGLHGMTAGFFEREDWWPKIGIGEQAFLEQLAPGTKRLCGKVFPGICDDDMVDLAVNRLAPRRFVYLLTLNSHIPVDRGVARSLGCDAAPAPFGSERTCTLGRLWIKVMSSLARRLSAPGVPPADILIVGDHAPPLFLPADRDQFVPGMVPWVLLSRR